MTEMQERIAKAIHAKRCELLQIYSPWDMAGEETREISRGLAGVVLDELREPTEAMRDAADEPFHAAWKESRERALRLYGKEAFASAAFSVPIWRAMIDEARTGSST